MSENRELDARRRRKYIALIVGIGVVLHLPSLWWGFLSDDYSQQLVLRGIIDHETLHPWALYEWGSPPQPGTADYDVGAWPWWTSPDFEASFLRPVTSLTLWLDHTLFGEWAPGYHLTGLLWFAALLFLIYPLYRALGFSDRGALWALLLFSTTIPTMWPVSWPANRNSLVAVFFAVAALLAITRFEALGHRRWLVSSIGLALLAALSKESGVITFALLALYLQLMRRRSDAGAVRRWANVGTGACIVAAVAYVVLFLFSGYGTNSAFYSTPWVDPLAYVKRLALLFTVGGLSFLALSSLDIVVFRPEVFAPSMVLFVVVLLPVIWIIRKQIKGHPATIFLVLWAVLALLPQGSVMPSDRLLFFSAVAVCGLLGLFVAGVLGERRTQLRWRRRLALVLVFLAVPVSGISKCVTSGLMASLGQIIRTTIATADVGPVELGRREVFMLQSPGTLIAFNTLAVWGCENDDHDVRIWQMQAGRRGVEWTRVDERIFELQTLDEPFLTGPLEIVFRTTREVPAPGTVFSTALFTAEILESGEEGVTRFRVHCPDSLDLPRYRFLRAQEGRLVVIPPPAIGETIVLPTADLAHALML